jgi:SAM-dependent methyltransferase
VSSDSPQQLRATFEEVPELYDRARPGYPVEVFDDLARLARLPEAARVLEIGCGTGQATVALAERGYRITCVELGEQLAAFARRKLSAFPAVEVINANFETWRPTDAAYDAVVSFTAFHWIDPVLRYEKSASLLRDGGALALVGSLHVLPPDGDQFFAEVQADYEAVLPDDDKTRAGGPTHPDSVSALDEEIEASGFFRSAATRRYLWEVIYTSEEYIALLSTYSGHRVLADAARERLYDLIRHRIQTRPGGTVRKTYLTMLNVARLRRAAAG